MVMAMYAKKWNGIVAGVYCAFVKEFRDRYAIVLKAST